MSSVNLKSLVLHLGFMAALGVGTAATFGFLLDRTDDQLALTKIPFTTVVADLVTSKPIK